MSIKVITQVWDRSKQTGTALLLLLAIADYAHDDGTNAFPSIDTLAHKARMGKRNVQKILRKLEESGELSTQIGAGPGGCNMYSIHLMMPDNGVNHSSGGGCTVVQGGGEPQFTRSVI